MNVQEAFEAVPRELFVPDEIFVRDEQGWLVPLLREQEPERWRAVVDGEDPVVTRTAFDPAVPEELRDAASGRGVEAVSSNSAPAVVRAMLEMLDLDAGMRVLEIGTGTGWNAALMAKLVGPSNVVSVEIDPGLAEVARRNLGRVGCGVRVVAGDGELGWSGGTPYDRVIATAAVVELPYAWVAQTRPGGRIVAPWGPTFHPDCPVALLEVSADGTAEGRFRIPGWFMPLRGQSSASFDEAEKHWERAGRPDVGRYGVTVTRAGQTLWLDSSDNVVG